MPSTVQFDTMTNLTGSFVLPVRDIRTRVIQRYITTYTSGEWNPDNTSNWVPGSWVDFAPKRADSKIIYSWRAPHAWSNAGHAISTWRFYANGLLYHVHSVSGTYIENGNTYCWEVPSWGTSTGRIGYQVRSHANDNNEVRIYRTNYWNGGGGNVATVAGQLMVEEIAGVFNG